MKTIVLTDKQLMTLQHAIRLGMNDKALSNDLRGWQDLHDLGQYLERADTSYSEADILSELREGKDDSRAVKRNS